MSPSEPQPEIPDVDRLAQSMLLLHGGHDHEHGEPSARSDSRYRAPAFTQGPERATALREATRAERERYLRSGLQPVDCRFCHVTVNVKKWGPMHTAVQWTTEASQRCAYFCEIRTSGGETARTRACPKLADSIDHAVAEGYL